MSDPSDQCFEIEFKSEVQLDNCVEPEDYVTKIQGSIYCSDELEEKRKKAGKIEASYVHISQALNDDQDLYEVFDSSQTLLDCYEIILDNDYECFSSALPWEDIPLSDLLYIDTVEVEKKYRGNNIGKNAVIKTAKTYGSGCGLIVLKPFPLQYSGKLEQIKKQQEKIKMKKAFDDLKRYWGELGFKQLPGAEYFAFNCYEAALPPLTW
jgi:virulence-associated protein VapD